MNYTQDLPRDAVDSDVEKALKIWEEVTPLTFSRIYEGEADIMITFAVRGKKQTQTRKTRNASIYLVLFHWKMFQRDSNYLSFQ